MGLPAGPGKVWTSKAMHFDAPGTPILTIPGIITCKLLMLQILLKRLEQGLLNFVESPHFGGFWPFDGYVPKRDGTMNVEEIVAFQYPHHPPYPQKKTWQVHFKETTCLQGGAP